MMYGNNSTAPPLNDLLQPDIYSRLDAEAIERTRVANTQLLERLRMQEKVLLRYQRAAELFHARQEALVRRELKRITEQLPASSRIRDFRLRFASAGLPPDPDGVKERRVRGVPEERHDLPFCERYFIHHLPNKKKFYKQRTPTPPFKHAPAADAAQGSLPASGSEVLVLPPLTVVSDNAARPMSGAGSLHAALISESSQDMDAAIVNASLHQGDKERQGYDDEAQLSTRMSRSGQEGKKRGNKSVSFHPIEENDEVNENTI